MKFEVAVAGKTFAIDLVPGSTGLRGTIDGREVVVDAVWTGAHQLSLLIDGRSYDLEVHAGRDGTALAHVGGMRLIAELDPAPSGNGRVRHGAAHGEMRILAPMPGKVVVVLVEAGERVEPGHGLVVVEAMKMENELTATGAGVVRAIHVRPGQVVEGGQILIEIGSATES